MNVHTRKAMPSDAVALAHLVTQLGYASQAEQVAQRLRALPAAGQSVIVAEADARVVGMVHVSRYRTLLADNVAELLALIVEERWRGQGIGSRLLGAAEEWALQAGCSELYVRTNIVRQRAHEFYTRHGFQHIKTSLTLAKPLAGSPSDK